MKILVVYYSKSGNTKLIAQKLAENLTADLEELIETQPRQGILGNFIAMKDAVLQKGSAINDLKHQVADYDAVIIGTPIWSWNMSNPIRSFLQKHKQNLKHVAFFATMGGSGDQRAFLRIEKLSGLTPIATLSFMDSKIKKDAFKTDLLNFVEIIKKKLAVS